MGNSPSSESEILGAIIGFITDCIGAYYGAKFYGFVGFWIGAVGGATCIL